MPTNSIKTFNRRGYGVTVRRYSCYTSNDPGPPLTGVRCWGCEKKLIEKKYRIKNNKPFCGTSGCARRKKWKQS